MNFPFRNVIFDGGAVIELLLSGVDSELYKKIINEKIIPTTSILAVIETEYILCRKLGKDKALEKIDAFLSSNYFDIISLDSLRREISLLKCYNPIALPDCTTVAIALNKKVPALFARREKELVKQMEKEPFNIQMFFLEDF